MGNLTRVRGLFFSANSVDKPTPFNNLYGWHVYEEPPAYAPLSEPSEREGIIPSEGVPSNHIGPLYKNPVQSVIDAMTIPHILNRPNKNKNIWKIPAILADANIDEAVKEITDEELGLDTWENLFDLLVYAYENQATLNDMSVTDPTITVGEENFREIGFGTNTYISNSLKVTMADPIDIELDVNEVLTIDNRLGKIEFIVKFNDDFITFSIYYSPDMYMYDYGMIDYDILDVHDNNRFALNNSIIDTMINYERKDDYQNITLFSTTKVDWENIHPDWNPEYEIRRFQRQFYIFHHLKTPAPNFKMVAIIKDYLEKKHQLTGGGPDMDFLIHNYPDLFSETTVIIYPLVNNVNPEHGTINASVSIKNILSLLESQTLSLEKEKIEIFNLEGYADYDDVRRYGRIERFLFHIPLVAYEEALFVSKDFLHGPISKRFSQYTSKHSIYNNNDSWEQFHFYLKIALKLSLSYLDENVYKEEGVLDIRPPLVNKQFRLDYQPDPANVEIDYLKGVEFKFRNTKYYVHSLKYQYKENFVWEL